MKIDSRAISDYVKKVVKPDQQLILFGRSFGAATAICEAVNNPEMFDKIILEGAFTSFKDCVKHIAPCKLGYLFACACKAEWRSIDIIDQVKEPILFITGDNDKIVPSWMSRQMQCAATNSKYTQLYVLEGSKHGHLWQ